MAIALTTNAQKIGEIWLAESGRGDRYFQVNAYYQKANATQANVYVQLVFLSNSSVNGDGNCSVNGGTKQGFDFSANSTATFNPITVTYNTSTGQSKNNSLTVTLSDMSAVWSDGTEFDATPQNNVSITYDLPNIDPSPNATFTSVTVQSDGYNGNAVAGFTTVRATFSLLRCRSATLSWSGAGVTGSQSVSVSYSTTAQTKTVDVLVPASIDNYTLSFSLKFANNTSSGTRTNSIAVKGYSLPTYANTTYTARCDSTGQADSQGEYGRLYLTWTVTPIDTSNPNAMQEITVKLNGTTITQTSGSISAGYRDYIFSLPVNTQGNLEVYFRDKISNNTITSLVVPKSTMPMSWYQSGDSVGVSIGRMATDSGFWCYEQFYYKDPSSTSVYPIIIEDGYLKASGGSTPLPLMEQRVVSATISKAVGSSVNISAPTVNGYTFLCWASVGTYGWQASVYVGNNNANTTIYVANNAGSTTGTGTVRAYAIYQRTQS